MDERELFKNTVPLEIMSAHNREIQERTSYEDVLPLEFKPDKLRMWYGRRIRSVAMQTADRVLLDRDGLTICWGRSYLFLSLEDKELFINHLLSNPIVKN